MALKWSIICILSLTWMVTPSVVEASTVMRRCSDFRSQEFAQSFYEHFKDATQFFNFGRMLPDADGQVCTHYPYPGQADLPSSAPRDVFTIGGIEVRRDLAYFGVAALAVVWLGTKGWSRFQDKQKDRSVSQRKASDSVRTRLLDSTWDNVGTPPLEVRVARVYRSIDYHSYIQSPEWKMRADALKQSVGRRCQVCNGTERLEAHHRTYDNLGNEQPGDVTILCHDCHAMYHYYRGMPG